VEAGAVEDPAGAAGRRAFVGCRRLVFLATDSEFTRTIERLMHRQALERMMLRRLMGRYGSCACLRLSLWTQPSGRLLRHVVSRAESYRCM